MQKSLTLFAALLLSASSAYAAELRIGLQDDIDIIDPDRSRAFVNRIVFTSFCDTLIDIDQDMNYVPRLATEWNWGDDNMSLTMTIRDDATFHDGTPVDAEAIKYNIERSKTLEGSLRRSEIAAVDTVEVVDPHTVKLNLSQPDSTLISQLSGWAGMIISPTAAEKGDFSQAPACSGPYKFVERVQNDKIVFDKYEDYWNADEYHFDRLVFMPIPDATVRLANLRAGSLDIIERMSPTDLEILEGDSSTTVVKSDGLGYQGFMINLTKAPGAEQSALAKDARLRQALSLAIDRNVIAEVVGANAFLPASMPFPPSSFAYDERFVIKADAQKARELIKEAGYDRVPVEIQFANNTQQQQIYELVQAMAAEAGFDVSLRAVEFTGLQASMREGTYQAAQAGWAGRVDPDGNIAHYIMCKGTLNDSGFCSEEVDAALEAARTTTDVEERKKQYAIVQEVLSREVPQVFLYFQPWLYGVRTEVSDFRAYPDGMIRLDGVTKSN